MPTWLKRWFIHHLVFYSCFAFLLNVTGLFSLSDHTLYPSVASAIEATTTPFISVDGTKLTIGNEPYQFTGVNAFHLATLPGANAGCGHYEKDLDGFFSKLRRHSVVRVWAFQGAAATNVTTKKIDWAGLDRVVNAAEKNGMKLILVLGDQAGACDDGHWKDKAWYEVGYKQAYNDYGNGLTPLPYLEYVKLVVDRYKNSPAVALWEPVNEPAASDCTAGKGYECYSKQVCPDEAAAAQALRGFFDAVGTEIKRIDPNHLISSGVIGDGQCGAIWEDYQYIHESPGIDVASYHDYQRVDQPMPGDEWNGLQKRLDQMKLIDKPLIIGEVGMVASNDGAGCMSFAARKDRMKAKMDAQFAAGIAGILPWALTGSTASACNYDIPAGDPLLTLLRYYPVPMGTYVPLPDTQAPSAPGSLTPTATSSSQVTLTWKPSTDNYGVVRYDIFRNDVYFSSTTGTTFTNTKLNPVTKYTYHVKGKDAANNNSVASNKVTITTPPIPTPTPTPIPDLQPPTAPSNLKATVLSSTQVKLTWNASVDNVAVIRYDVFRNDVYFSSTMGTSLTVSNLSPQTSYTFHVKGKDAVPNNSAASNKVTVTTF